MVRLMAISSKRVYATHHVSQVCCSQSPCPQGRPLLTHTSTGDIQILTVRSGSVSVVPLSPGVHNILFKPSECLWLVWGLILNVILPLLPSFWGLLLCPWMWSIFFWCQHFPADGYSAANCNFEVFTEDECICFYSTILQGTYQISVLLSVSVSLLHLSPTSP